MNKFPNIAKVVRENRVRVGVSQTDLSNQLGYKNGQFVSNVERGLCSINHKKIDKLSKIIGAEPDDVRMAIIQDVALKIGLKRNL